MVQKYTSSDFDLFNKIDLSEDSNKYKKKSSIKKDISEKPISSYLNKDKHKFDLLEIFLIFWLKKTLIYQYGIL